MKLTVVIPCFNEEQVIDSTLSSLLKYLPIEYEAEIIVVDNGSTDRSVMLAEKYNVRVIKDSSNTVAGVRNAGVKNAKGDILIFLDADVEVTGAWAAELIDALLNLEEKDILGSHCSVPPTDEWLFKYWYKAIEVNSSSHVGTGHMILHRCLFERLEGFNDTLTTGEDYDFCSRAKQLGGVVVENEKLVVYHNGYPRALSQFFKREMWHGTGDWQTFSFTRPSKVLFAAIAYFFAMIMGLSSISLSPVVGLFIILGTQVVLFLIALRKFGSFDGVKGLLVRTLVFNAYFMARFLSFLGAKRMFRKQM